MVSPFSPFFRTALLGSKPARANGFDPALMPTASMRRGEPEIFIADGFQGGIYHVYAYVNPGEAGFAYLKVFEATRNTPLSEHRIPSSSTEYIGWSVDPRNLFFYNSRINILEGNWGQYYPARFELWFVPTADGPQRKLIEKIFRVEGWQF